MSADSDNTELIDTGAREQAGPGARLRAAREQAGLSVDDVAHELHLDIAVVIAVEADQLDSLGAPVFVKGYLRGYAKLLDIPEQEVVDSWQPEESDPDVFRAQSVQTEVRTGASLSNFVLWLMLGILLLASLLYLLSGDDDDEVVIETPAPAAAGPAEPLPTRESEFVVAAEVAPEFAANAPDDAREPMPAETVRVEGPTAATAEPEPVVEVSQPVDTVDIRLTFSDECWVELSDSRRRLLYGLEKAGNVRSFSARPPLRFFVGNVEAVQIAIGDAPYEIPARVKTGRNTARFVLDLDDIQEME